MYRKKGKSYVRLYAMRCSSAVRFYCLEPGVDLYWACEAHSCSRRLQHPSDLLSRCHSNGVTENQTPSHISWISCCWNMSYTTASSLFLRRFYWFQSTLFPMNIVILLLVHVSRSRGPASYITSLCSPGMCVLPCRGLVGESNLT